jgi:hypothetical protein
MEESENKIQTVSLDFLTDVKEAKFEKPIFEKATNATIIEVPTAHINTQDKEGLTKDGKAFTKMFFTVKFKTEDEKEFRESYGFSLFIEGDKKTVYYGKESAAREFVDVALQYIDSITKDSSITEILNALANRNVKVITKPYGPGKSPKTQVISYL